MKFTIDGREYAVRFRYWQPVTLPKTNESPIDLYHPTDCMIRDKLTNQEFQGTVFRYYRDKPDEYIARKKALSKALNAMALSKAQRTSVWNEVFNQMKRFKEDKFILDEEH